MILSGALANGLLQANVEDGMRGRIMAAYSFVSSACRRSSVPSLRALWRAPWVSIGPSAAPP